jgi:hypothetical protein
MRERVEEEREARALEQEADRARATAEALDRAADESTD